LVARTGVEVVEASETGIEAGLGVAGARDVEEADSLILESSS